MAFKASGAVGPWEDSLASIRREAAERALQLAGSSKRAACLLVEAGYTSTEALRRAPWSAAEAGGPYQSAEWRLSVRPGCTPSALAEARAFRDQLTGIADKR